MIRILYDGDCPFCAKYTQYTRLKRRHGDVELINARERLDLVEAYAAQGHDIDESFIVEVEGHVLSRGAAMAYIHANLAPKWTGLPFLAHQGFLEAIYPTLKGGRNFVLKLLGRKKIRS
ncbi:MAG: DCC1-like thiol-disulfide oxidoreductase family protein [Pseudomonadota bacterium]